MSVVTVDVRVVTVDVVLPCCDGEVALLRCGCVPFQVAEEKIYAALEGAMAKSIYFDSRTMELVD